MRKKIISCLSLLCLTGICLGFATSQEKNVTKAKEFSVPKEIHSSILMGNVNNTEPVVKGKEANEPKEPIMILSEKQTNHAETKENVPETKEAIEPEKPVEIKDEEQSIEQPQTEEELVAVENNEESSCIIPIEFSGDVQESFRGKAAGQLQKIPTNLQQAFIDRGWHFYITTEDIAQTYFDGQYSSVMGVTFADGGGGSSGLIKIEDRERAINGSVLHEFGHFMYWGGTRYRDYESVMQCMESDLSGAKSMGIVYGLDSGIEYYAECFSFVINNPEQCQKYIPNTYNLIMSDIENF